MATTEMVPVRIDKRTKARAAKALAAMGLSVSDAVRVRRAWRRKKPSLSR
jgi:addiction module RelB/DinJ family antitoxin